MLNILFSLFRLRDLLLSYTELEWRDPMPIRFLWSFMLLSNLGTAISARADVEWKVGNEKLNVRLLAAGTGIWISPWCSLKEVCQASAARKEALETLTSGKYFEGEGAGVNPGSVSCRKRFQGQVVLAVGSPGETQGFCKFSDGSLITLNAL
jgi:hypothetical protein